MTTREAALKSCKDRLEHLENAPSHHYGKRQRQRAIELEKVKIEALRPITREQVERARGEWIDIDGEKVPVLLTLEELNLREGEYAVCLARRNPFSEWYPMVIKRVRNGYVSPVMEQYVTDILGGFRIPDLKKRRRLSHEDV